MYRQDSDKKQPKTEGKKRKGKQIRTRKTNRHRQRKEVALTCKYKLMNQVREYWYMGSMLARSEMQKKRMEEWTATGL